MSDSLRGPVTTLAASGIDANTAVNALTVAVLDGQIDHATAEAIAGLVRAQERGVQVFGPVRALLINAAARVAGPDVPAPSPVKPCAHAGATLLPDSRPQRGYRHYHCPTCSKTWEEDSGD